MKYLTTLATLLAFLSTAANAQTATTLAVLRSDFAELTDLRNSTAQTLAATPFASDLRRQLALRQAATHITTASDHLTAAAQKIAACADALAAYDFARTRNPPLAAQIADVYDQLHTSAGESLDAAQTELLAAEAILTTLNPLP
jgi:hypothetical protein